MDRLSTNISLTGVCCQSLKRSYLKYLVYIFYQYGLINDWFGLKKQAQGKYELELQAIKEKIMSLYEKNKQWLF